MSDEQMAQAAEAYLRANGVEGITIKGGGEDWFVSIGFAEHERFVTAYSKRNPNTPNDPLYLAEQALQTLIRNERPETLAPEPEQVETPQDESDGETGEAAEGSEAGYPLGHASEDAVSGDAGQTGDVGAGRELEVGRTGLGDEVSNGDDTLSGEGWDVDGAGDIRDADFTVEDFGSEEDLLADEAQDTLAIEGADLETEAAPNGPIAYGASTIDGLIREKLGRVSQIARELKAVQQEGWTVEEYAYLQNLMVRMDRGEAPDDQASRERFLAIAMKSQAMSRIDAVRDRKEGELEEIGQRRDFDAAVYYEPAEGWP